jgi:exodeoxyribonuclease VII large subunit
VTDLTPKPLANTPEFSVSELATAIKRTLEDGFGFVRLRGEISGYRGPHSSGHCYFALKDDRSKIEAVIWKGNFSRLRIKPDEGMEVIATGKISSFPGSSKYQIVIEALEPAGIGALMVQLEERKKKLAAEGLFDPARKRPLPFMPRVIGIVTSPTGAVIRDMLHGFAERCPAHVVVWPVRVQGEGSAQEIATAVRGFNAILPGGRVPRPEVLIVARGGGSMEDLWCFNDEAVVRAVAASALPVISAVGHETDWTLIDLVADARAPTPTKAAEWAVPKHSDLIIQVHDFENRLTNAIRRQAETSRQRFDSSAHRLSRALTSYIQRRHTLFAQIAGRLPNYRSLIVAPRQRFDAIGNRLNRALLSNTRTLANRHARVASRLQPGLVEVRLARARDRLEASFRRSTVALTRGASQRRVRLERVSGRLSPEALSRRVASRRQLLDGHVKLLQSLSYRSVLARGYAVVRGGEGQMLRRIRDFTPGRALDIEVADGRIAADVRHVIEQRGSAAPQPTPTEHHAQEPPAKAPAKPRAPTKHKQGTLF